MKHQYQVEVVIGQLDKPLSYLVPEHLLSQLQPLSRVLVPLQKRQVMGFCLSRPHPLATPAGKLKLVADLLDDVTCLPPDLLGFFERAAAYYQAPLGRFLELALPAGLGRLKHQDMRSIKTLSLLQLNPLAARDNLKPPESKILDLLEQHGSLFTSQLKEFFPRALYWLPRMEKKGLLRISRQPLIRDLSGEIIAPEARPEQLSQAQVAAIEAINWAIRQEKFSSFVLHGVTGSGKTEVYLAAIEQALNLGKSALLLAPEIGISLRLQGIVQTRFAKEKVALLHSGLTPAQRRSQWAALATGQARIALGARSAIFAPLRKLGVICVDEEQDEAYKQEDRIRYNGRDLALLRGQEQKCPVILGSATPGLTTYHLAMQGRHQLLRLPERVRALPMPRMELIDLRSLPKLIGGFLSPRLYQALQDNKAAGKQSMLFLNRRGFAPAVICRDCGQRLSCAQCSLSLTWHQQRQRLVCHLCGLERRLPDKCPHCSAPGERLKTLGLGTEAVEEKLRELQPEWRILRIDRDTANTAAKISQLMRQMLNNEVDVVVGTQMLSKGHHFPNLSLVGVLMADQGLNQPDFRAAERVFTLLTQVAGRAGREQEQGLVLVQTYNPEHHAIQAAFKHDEQGFYQHELEERQALSYPPFGRLISVRLDSMQEEQARQSAARLAGLLKQAAQKLAIKSQILGPAPAPIAKVQNYWRYFLLIKAGSASQAAKLLRLSLHWLGEPGVRLVVDVDPLQLF